MADTVSPSSPDVCDRHAAATAGPHAADSVADLVADAARRHAALIEAAGLSPAPETVRWWRTAADVPERAAVLLGAACVALELAAAAYAGRSDEALRHALAGGLAVVEASR